MTASGARAHHARLSGPLPLPSRAAHLASSLHASSPCAGILLSLLFGAGLAAASLRHATEESPQEGGASDASASVLGGAVAQSDANTFSAQHQLTRSSLAPRASDSPPLPLRALGPLLLPVDTMFAPHPRLCKESCYPAGPAAGLATNACELEECQGCWHCADSDAPSVLIPPPGKGLQRRLSEDQSLASVPHLPGTSHARRTTKPRVLPPFGTIPAPLAQRAPLAAPPSPSPPPPSPPPPVAPLPSPPPPSPPSSSTSSTSESSASHWPSPSPSPSPSSVGRERPSRETPARQ